MLEAENKRLINWSKVKDWIVGKQLLICILVVNLLLAYYFVRLFRPAVDEEVIEEDE